MFLACPLAYYVFNKCLKNIGNNNVLSIFSLPNDINKLWQLYLTDDEIMYYTNKWYMFDKNCMCNIASKNGWLDLLKYAKKRGCPWSSRTMSVAAMNGHLSIIKWSRNYEDPCAWTEYVILYAKKNKHFDIVEWALQNGCKYNPNKINEIVCKGDIEMLKTAISDYYPMDERSTYIAIHYKRYDMLQYLLEHDCPMDPRLCGKAIEYGRLDIFRLLIEKGASLHKNACTGLVKFNDLGLLKWSINCGCICTEDTLAEACKYGSLEMLQYLIDIRCPCDLSKCYERALQNKNWVEIIKWLHICMDHPLDDSVYLGAMRSNNIDLLKWLISNNIKCTVNVTNWAFENNYDYFQYLIKNKFPYDIADCFDIAIIHGNLTTLKWCINNGAKYKKETCVRVAKQLNVEMFEYLIKELGCRCDPYLCRNAICASFMKIPDTIRDYHSRKVKYMISLIEWQHNITL